MTELTVKDINSNWSISFDFSTRKGISASYDLSSMTVGRLKREIYNANNLYAVEQQKLIFMGIILNHDDVELKNLVSLELPNDLKMENIVFNFWLLPFFRFLAMKEPAFTC